ncbi:MAG: heparinase, partial [Nonomuraea sp.]|nr:heparinase [Nonomuraea sp.]
GMPTYTAATFGPRRYAEWPFQSGWHNVPEPGGSQLPGRDHAAHRVAVRPGGLRADLAPAYGGQVERWDRDVRLEAGRITVTEDWSGLHGNALLRHLLSGDVEHGDGWATVAADGRALRLTWDPAAAAATIERRPLDDAKLRRAWGEHLTRLTLTLTAPAPAGRFTATWMALEQVTTAP